jgi:hypothetical protein
MELRTQMTGQTPSPHFDISTVGTPEPDATVEVTIGPQFLELFSEQLYTSPNKAFEELISNSWDAGASAVYVGMSTDLASKDAAVWVLDNGESMDVAGLQLLWSVANSEKPRRTDGRPQIGKFGIGKLSTYVLAHNLTHICKASDGVIRAVTMDYRRIGSGPRKLHIDPVPLEVRILEDDELRLLLSEIDNGQLILEHIDHLGEAAPWENAEEFGGEPPPKVQPTGTWTLALMTELKGSGREMQPGRIQRMLRTSLPLGASLGITFNGKALESTKIEVGVSEQWSLGPGLGLTPLELPSGEAISVVESNSPYPHIHIEGLGRVTGTVRLFEDSIAGGKSNQLGGSNGF